MTFEVYYRNNGEYPDPEEIEITKGVHRIEGQISDFVPEEAIQYLDYDAGVEVDGEIKRLHFNKLDILSDGSFVAEVDVIDNLLFLSFLPYIVAGLATLTGVAVVINQAGKASEKSEAALRATGVNLQWIAVIIISIGVFYTIAIRK